MKDLKLTIALSTVACFEWVLVQFVTLAAITPSQSVSACPAVSRSGSRVKVYDVIVFGDEVSGVMTAIQVKRELRKRQQSGRVLLITEGDTTKGIGGELVRGGLAYLDRNQVPRDRWSTLGKFAPASQLYQEFLTITGTQTIALDRFKAAVAFKRILAEEAIDVLGNVRLQAVTSTPQTVCSLTALSNGTFAAKQFIDATQSGKLAKMAGVKMLPGFAALGLPDSSLSVGLVFETDGLTIEQLRQREATLIQRLQNPSDPVAQTWLKVASGNQREQREAILATLVTISGAPATLHQATSDSADVRSLAFTTAFHGSTNSAILNARETLDRANIAILQDRLSFNALLFYVDAERAIALSESGAKPEAYMLQFAAQVQHFFLGLGASRVEIMSELYIRSTDQMAHPVEELSSTRMTQGGVPANEALGTFSYHLDVRGGIKGLGARAASAGIKSIAFHAMPTFNYGFRHTLPQDRENLAVLGPASGFGGLGEAAGRIVEFNVSVGEGLAIAVAKAIVEKQPLHTIQNREVRQALDYPPIVYGRATEDFHTIFLLEKSLRTAGRVAVVPNRAKQLVQKAQPSADTAQTAETYLERGIQQSEQGNYFAAVEADTEAIKRDRTNPLTYYNRGVALTYLHKDEAALADYTTALRLKPDFIAAYKNRGLVYTQSSRHLQEAVADYNQALKLAPNDAASYLGKGLALFLQGKRSAALEALTQAIKLNPALAIAYFTRASVYHDLGDHANARANYQTAAALYRQQGNQSAYQNTLGAIQSLR